MSTTTKFRPVHRIDRSRALDFLSDETDGLIWSAYFRKTDGSMREMVCRRGVAKALAGGGLRYDARSKGLVPVFGTYIHIPHANLGGYMLSGFSFLSRHKSRHCGAIR
jgi:hypothetical protein